MRTMNGLAMLMAGTMLSGACEPNKGTIVTATEDGVTLFSPICEDGDCDLAVVANASDLRGCYGWDPVEGWDPSTPAEVVAACPNPDIVLNCEMIVDTLVDVTSVPTGGLTPACECIPEAELNALCCEHLWEELDLSAADALVEQINDDCLPGDAHAEAINCEGGWTDQGECMEGGFAVAPNADLILYLDQLNSYIEVTTPYDNQTFPVSGGGSAMTTPNGFLTATAWADDGELGGDDWTGWKWWMTAPLDIDMVSGAFTVPVTSSTPPFHGGGYQDSTPKLAEVFMAEEPTGNVYPLTDTFELDFSQTSYGWTIEVHLEGDFEAN